MITLSFGAWLQAQKHRDDPIGDLAKDAIRAKHIGVETAEELRSHIRRAPTDTRDALRALKAAEREWNGGSK